ncbi:MAG: hypothetical protein ABIQ30_05795 [Devosia sp.]
MARAIKAKPATGTPAEPPAGSARVNKEHRRKQAVVLIHGIGEQVPLGTLREFVETVYQRDDQLEGEKQSWSEDAPDTAALNQVWMVPDDATGTAELRRITTPPNRQNLRTDFFEFYWADITQGTPIDAVFGWVKGLIIRSPFSVPLHLRVWIAWLALWAVAILFVTFTLSTLDPTGTLFGWLIAPTKAAIKFVHVPLGLLVAIAGVMVGVDRFFGEAPWQKVKVTLPLALLVAGPVLTFLPTPMLDSDKIWSGLIAFALAALLNGVIAPYAGDIVRYVRAGPATMEKRRQVRERGLALLDALHRNDPETGLPLYERVIIVAHSLGSIIGYDLIQLYWQKEGPTHSHPAVPAAAEAFHNADSYVKSWWVNKERDEPFPVDAYQRQQALVYEAIKTDLKFRISDFITLGSPLTHADFLLRDDADSLEVDFEERLFSSSPPRPDRPYDTMTYWVHGKTGPYVHFAAPFSAVRWTNIYDESWFPLLGDIVSGSLTGIFGPGIKEHRVEIERPKLPGLLKRLVTHTLYWSWDDSFKTALPAHIRLLREALFLEGEMKSRVVANPNPGPKPVAKPTAGRRARKAP